jgi:predicted DNA-binding transcriptional regulator AlpA
MDIVQKFRKDVAVPKSPESEGSRLITLKQIEQEHGVSRSALHTYRRSTSFPQPVQVEGSTKIQYRAEDVAAWFEANPPQQGKRTDLAPQPEPQGAPVTTTTALDQLMETLQNPGLVGLRTKDATELVDAYRATVLREAAARLDKVHDYPSGDAKVTGAYLAGMENAANELRRMADELEG